MDQAALGMEANETPGQPHDNGRHPSSAGSDRFSCRGLAFGSSKEFAYEGGAGKPLDEYRRRTNEDGPASPDTVVSLPCIPSNGTKLPVGRKRILCREDWIGSTSKRKLGDKNHPAIPHHAPARDWPIPPRLGIPRNDVRRGVADSVSVVAVPSSYRTPARSEV